MVTSVELYEKSGDFCRMTKDIKIMDKQEHYYRSMNLKEGENVNLVDRWILACLVKGLQGKSKISKISLDKIAEYCKYTNEQGKEARFGIKTIQSSIDRLEEAKMIRVIKPEKRGQCTQYEIKDIKSYEKINEDFFNLDLAPAAKGYILCALQHNLNKDEETHQPNEMKTKTAYNVAELSTKYNTPLSTVYKVEKILKNAGILTVNEDPNMKRDKETRVIVQNREIDLQKVGLDVFVKVLVNHEQRLRDVEQNTVSKDDFEEFKKEMRLLLTAKDAKIIE